MKVKKMIYSIVIIMALILTNIASVPLFNAENMTDLIVYEKIIFDNIDVSTLDAKGFTSTKFTRAGSGQPFNLVSGESDQPVSKHWFSGDGNDTPYNGVSGISSKNIGIKPNTNSDNDRYYLNTPYNYVNFKMSVEVYWGVASGVAIGKRNVYPNSNSDSSVNIYFNNNRIQLNGALDFSTATVSGNNAGYSLYAGSTGLFDFVKNHSATNGKAYTLNVKMENGLLTVWVDGYDGVLRIRVSEDYEGETISLLGRKFGGDSGGFKSCLIRNLDDSGYVDFDNIDVSVLDSKDFTSTKLTRAASNQPFNLVEGEEDKPVSRHWFSGVATDSPYNGVSGVVSKNMGIKPNTNSSNDRYLLNTPYTYENFLISTEIYWGVASGVAIGENNVYPNSINDSSVVVYFNNNRIQVNGALNFNTAYVSGENVVWNPYDGDTGIFAFNKDFSATPGKVYTLNIKKEDNFLTIWVDGYDGVLTIDLLPNYRNGRIALFSRQFGGDCGGFKSCLVRDLDSEGSLESDITEDVVFEKEIAGNYASVTLHSDKSNKLIFDLSYDVSKFTYETVVIPYNTLVLNPDFKVNPENGKIHIRLLTEEPGELVRLMFKCVDDEPDFSGFILSGNTYLNGMRNKTNIHEKIFGDVNNDKTVTVADLTRLKKYASGISVEINELNSKLGSFEISSNENINLLRNNLLGNYSSKISPQTSSLFGKKALFLGDSIAYGANDIRANLAWGGRIGAAYGMNGNRIIARSGWYLAQHNNSNPIVNQYDVLSVSEISTFDYVILHGGVNDVWHSKNAIAQNLPCGVVPLGEITPDGTTTFDVTTVYGALERLIATTKERAPSAKIGYIINPDISNAIGDMSGLVTAIKAVCEKWDIPYLDLYSHTEFKKEFNNSQHLVDGVHPNAAGYEILAKYIGEWMETL